MLYYFFNITNCIYSCICALTDQYRRSEDCNNFLRKDHGVGSTDHLISMIYGN